jgi:GNAT superfamily N-acetyltransferase
MTSVDLRELTESHSARLHSMDPLLPVPAIPHLAVSDELIGVQADGSVAVGVARLSEPDPDEMVSTWGALRQYQLVVRLSGPAALDPLLTEWDRYLADRAAPGDEETSAVLMWPSRDTAPVPALVRHGFAPLVVCAARPAGIPTPPAPDALIRPAEPADLDVITDLNLAVVDYDAQFGVVTSRPSTRPALRTALGEALDRTNPGIWLAEHAGEPIGMIAVDLPPHADWMARDVGVAPIGYVGCLFVREDVRGGGVGRALVAEGHRALEEAGVAVTLLHHSLPNPRSTPFWYSNGYRPLWTVWQRRPAVR